MGEKRSGNTIFRNSLSHNCFEFHAGRRKVHGDRQYCAPDGPESSALSIRLLSMSARLAALILLFLSAPASGQIWQQVVDPPAQVLPPVPAPASFATVTAPQSQPTFAPSADFFASAPDNRLLRPWHTFSLPPGTWGEQVGWDNQSTDTTTVRRFRIALFQPVELGGGYVGRGSGESLGYSFASSSVRMAVPLGDKSRIVSVRPVFRVDWIDASPSLDVPELLYSSSLEAGLRLEFGSDWSLIAGAQPGWFNDEKVGGRGFRVPAVALLGYSVVPEVLTLFVGVVRVDRNDFDIFPVAGLTWTPDPDTRVDLTFPKPRISRRIGHVPWLFEDWLFVGGSIGGNTWSARRADGTVDELTFFDFRLTGGYERLVDGGSGYSLEAGYVGGRRFEYLGDGSTMDLPGSFIVEAAFRF